MTVSCKGIMMFFGKKVQKIIVKIIKKFILWGTVLLQISVPLTRYLLDFRGVPYRKISIVRNSGDCIVIGNGPSLKSDIETLLSRVGSADFWAVNHFSEYDHFFILRPNVYFFLDSYFWDANAAEKYKEKRILAFKGLNAANWPIQLFVPNYADANYIQKMIDNPLVQVVRYNLKPVYLASNNLAAKLYAKKLLGPPEVNVIVHAMYFAILAGYRNVDLYGADTTMQRNLTVDQETNDVYIEYGYFYQGEQRERCMKNPYLLEPFTMREYFWMTTQIFYCHEVLFLLAESRGVKVRNKSSFSLIDAYPRV